MNNCLTINTNCPTVPPIYTWDSGTAKESGTARGTTRGTQSLKALAQAILTVPTDRDRAGQKSGQGEKAVPQVDKPVGQEFFQKEKVSLEKYSTAAKPLPRWCQADCPGLESLTLPGEGPVFGCVDPLDQRHWQRLDRLNGCPARRKQANHPLPEWCSSSCERYVRLDLPAGIILEWCVTGTNARNWTYVKIDTLAKCSAKQCQQTTTRR